MRNNIYIKSMLRQPVRTLLLFLLIGLAAYVFVMRAVEYVAVERHIEIIGANYRSIGFVPTGHHLDDVSAGAEILRNSPHVAQEDKRRQIEGVLHDFYSPDVMGMQPGLPMEDQLRLGTTYFYAELHGFGTDPQVMFFWNHGNPEWRWALPGGQPLNNIWPSPSGPGIMWLLLFVDEVVVGNPVHVAPGLPWVGVQGQGSGTFLWTRVHYNPENPYARDQVMASLELGERYFFRADYYHRFHWAADAGFFNAIPRQHQLTDWLDLRPVNAETGLWVVPAPGEGAIDFDAWGLSHLSGEIELLRHNIKAVTLQTTIDMTAMPDTQGRGALIRPVRGRMINLDDHLNQSPVAVVHHEFLVMNNLNIGDFITLDVHANQFIHSYIPDFDVVVRSNPDAATAYTIQLEIIGTYIRNLTFTRDEWGNEVPVPTPGRSFTWGIIYVPDSIIPAHITVGPPVRDLSHLGVYWPAGHLPSTWYSFMLADTRTELTFLHQYREVLRGLGLDLALFQAGSGGFWSAVEPILLVTFLNAAIFSVVLLMVLILVAFIYLRQRRRDFAIMRALGTPIHKIFFKLCLSVLLIGLPAAVIGGGLAWNFAVQQANNTLAPFAEMAAEETANPYLGLSNHLNASAAIRAAAETEISMTWFFGLVGRVALLFLIIITMGFIIPLRRPILIQLQGGSTRKAPKARKTVVQAPAPTPEEIMAAMGKLPNLNEVTYSKRRRNKFTNGFHFTKAHIFRSAAKTTLGFAIALFFILALGWLQETMRSTEESVDYLFDNTVVTVEMIPDILGVPGTFPFMTHMLMTNLGSSQVVDMLAPEGVINNAIIFHAEEDGSYYENWDEIVGFDRFGSRAQNNVSASIGRLFGVGSLQMLIEANSVELAGDEDEQLVATFRIEFMEGFYMDNFTHFGDFGLDNPIPVIIPQSLADLRGLAPGDRAWLAHAPLTPHWVHFRLIPIIIAGVHNELIINRPGLETTTIVPIRALDALGGWLSLYHHAALTVNTTHNRELVAARNEILEIAGSRTSTVRTVGVEVVFMDEEIRFVVGAMNQILILLEVMYPIAVALAVAIGAAMAMLMMMQMAKNAAIMRVLGTSERKTILLLCSEQLAVCLIGLAAGLAALIFFSLGFGPAQLATLAVLYFAGAIAGSVAGAVIIAMRAPLDLLQVRE